MSRLGQKISSAVARRRRKRRLESPPSAKLNGALDRARLGAIVENSEDAILSKDLSGIILSWNKAAQRLFGYRPREIIGRSVTLILPPDRLAEEKAILDRVRRNQRVRPYETVRIAKNGKAISVLISVSPLPDSQGRIIGASTILRDITDQKQTEVALRDSEQRLRAIVETAVDAIVTIDERGRIDSANPATERMFGYGAAEMVGQNVKMLMPEPYRGEHDGYLRNYIRTGRARIIGIGREVIGLRKDGTTFPLNLSVSEVRLDGKRLFTGILHDLTGRRRLERQILEAAANEQRRIGQDLHDGLCQDLVGIGFTADTLGRQMLARSAPEGDVISRLGDMMRRAAGQARDLAHGLNPVDLKGGGLPAALNGLTKKISHSFGVKCKFLWDGKAQVHDDTAATHLYRITQEAVGNAIRHGKATAVEIRFRCANGRLVLSIADNGSGLPGHVTERVGRTAVGVSEGMGLQTMQYRARVVGGTFEVTPRSGGGTVVTCSLIAHPARTIST